MSISARGSVHSTTRMRAGREPRQRLAGAQRRQRAFEPAQVDDGVSSGCGHRRYPLVSSIESDFVKDFSASAVLTAAPGPRHIPRWSRSPEDRQRIERLMRVADVLARMARLVEPVSAAPGPAGGRARRDAGRRYRGRDRAAGGAARPDRRLGGACRGHHRRQLLYPGRPGGRAVHRRRRGDAAGDRCGGSDRCRRPARRRRRSAGAGGAGRRRADGRRRCRPPRGPAPRRRTPAGERPRRHAGARHRQRAGAPAAPPDRPRPDPPRPHHRCRRRLAQPGGRVRRRRAADRGRRRPHADAAVRRQCRRFRDRRRHRKRPRRQRGDDAGAARHRRGPWRGGVARARPRRSASPIRGRCCCCRDASMRRSRDG